MASVDLTRIYFHVPKVSKIPIFSCAGSGLPVQSRTFGIATAHLGFAWVVKEVQLIAVLQEVHIHPDDCLVRAKDQESCF